MKFLFPGSPPGKARPRFFANRIGPRAYDPQHIKKIETQWEAKRQMLENAFKPIKTGPIGVKMMFGMPIPKRCSKRALKSICGKCHTSKPDIDNITKFFLDALNGIAYHDDCQVAHLEATKVYSIAEKSEIEIVEIDEKK